jgi:hypothetical protein
VSWKIELSVEIFSAEERNKAMYLPRYFQHHDSMIPSTMWVFISLITDQVLVLGLHRI